MTDEMMAKPWWASRGVVGPLVAALGMVLGIFGVEVDPETQGYVVDQLLAAITAATVIGGAVVGIIGRLRATRPVKF